MHSGPAGAVGVFEEHCPVVVSRSVGMEKAHYHVENEAHYKEHCRESKRSAVNHGSSSPLCRTLESFAAPNGTPLANCGALRARNSSSPSPSAATSASSTTHDRKSHPRVTAK